MSKKILFPQIKGLLHGSDYNPDQWLDRPDILEKDIEKSKDDKYVRRHIRMGSL